MPLNWSSATVLITGGGSGIGLAFAERFLAQGSTVIVVGRRADALESAKRLHPSLHTRVGDVSTPGGRTALAEWVAVEFSSVNVLVNNAGIQRSFDLKKPEPWETTRSEIAINVDAPVHLVQLLLPHLLQKTEAAIINVTSGLSFCPKADVPVYCATKAFLHSLTLSLRHQLAGTPVTVIEVIPPAVNTDLGGSGLHTFGVPLADYADGTFARLLQGDLEIPFGLSEKLSQGSRAEVDEFFKRLNPASAVEQHEFLKKQAKG